MSDQKLPRASSSQPDVDAPKGELEANGGDALFDGDDDLDGTEDFAEIVEAIASSARPRPIAADVHERILREALGPTFLENDEALEGSDEAAVDPTTVSDHEAKRAEALRRALELSASLSSTPLSSTPPPFSAMALESSRSAVWPLVLSLGVGIAIGFGLAMVFFVGGGQTQQPQSVTAGRADGRADARSEERPAPTVLVEPPIVPEEALTKSPVVAPPVTPRAGVPLPSATAVAPGPVAPLTSSSSTSSSAPSPMSSQTSSQTSSTASPIPTASAPVRTRTPPVPAPGRLLIRSTPSGAQVSLDGKSAGTTPLTLREVARGAHTVRVAREGFVSVERRVALTEASAVVTVSVDLVARPVPKPAAVPVAPARRPPPPSAGGAAETGALSVDSRPVGASVFIDGKLVGTTPLLIPTINAAGHTIAMELSGYKRWTSSVTITPGERTRVAASLEQ